MQLKNNINTEKKLIKEVAEQQSVERKQFEKKMTQEYKLKKERWKREMAVGVKQDTIIVSMSNLIYHEFSYEVMLFMPGISEY